jgi:hypothetical protein
MDELIEVFRNPPYFHCGCDKCFGFGSGEEDRMTSADILFAKHISFLNSYLSQKNIKMVMWADMLYCSMDALYWKCNEGVADILPKNILLNLWTHDNPGSRWLDPEYFEEKGECLSVKIERKSSALSFIFMTLSILFFIYFALFRGNYIASEFIYKQF